MIKLACPKCGHTVQVIGGDAFHDCPKTGRTALPTQYVRVDDEAPKGTPCR